MRETDAYRPLLADRARIPAMVAIVLAVMVIVVFGVRFADQDMPGHLDRSLDALIRNDLFRSLSINQALVSLGNPVPAALLVAAVAGTVLTVALCLDFLAVRKNC